MLKLNSKTIPLILAAGLVAVMSGCSTPPPKKEKPSAPKVVETQPKKADVVEQIVVEKSLAELLELRNQAANNGDWTLYLHYTHLAWQKSSTQDKAKLEEQAWGIVNALSAQQRDNIAQSEDADIQAWNALYLAMQGANRTHSTELLNLRQFDSEAIFNNHLLPKLLAENTAESPLKQIAVLLPMQGKYKVISQQIRNGIIKAFFASNQSLTIKFYDSTDLNELENVYTLAKQEGADRIIGPLRKEAVQILASFHDNDMLALNSTEQANLLQFNFKSANPEMQMRSRFEKLGFTRIGILTNNKPKNIADAKTLQNLWQQLPTHIAEISIYPDERPKLRQALGQLIHETHSKERRNNIRWIINNKVEYFPRTREDLDAIVILDSSHRLAVFRPQFDFFGLNIPMYSDSKLTPKDFQQTHINKDLKDVRFLSYPAVINPHDLTNKFEAFGWDSFLVTTHLEEMQSGGCLTNAKTGILSIDDNQVQQQQIWLTYNRKGELEEAPNIDHLVAKIRDEEESEAVSPGNIENAKEVENINNATPTP